METAPLFTGSKRVDSDSIKVGTVASVRSTSTETGEDFTNKSSAAIPFDNATVTANRSGRSGTMVNQGAINLNAGTALVTGDLAVSGTVAIANGATFKAGSANQTVANAMRLSFP